MDFRKGSASILCATIGLGLSQNFAVSSSIPDENSLATGEQNVSGDSKLQEQFKQIQIFVGNNLLLLCFAPLICACIKCLMLEEKVTNLEGKLFRNRYSVFLKILNNECKNYKVPDKVYDKIVDKISESEAKDAIELILNNLGKKTKYLRKFVIYTLRFCEVIDSKTFESYNNNKNDKEFLDKTSSQLGDDYKEILKKISEFNDNNFSNNDNNILDPFDLIDA